MDSPLYQQLAIRFERAIRDGRIRGGERLPSVRELQRRDGVSRNTVLAAYRLLEQQGYAQAQARSGYFARQPARLPAPPTARPGEHRWRAADLIPGLTPARLPSSALNLADAIPAAELLPLAELHRHLRRAAGLGGAQALAQLAPIDGLPELRQAIAAHMLAAGCQVQAGDTLITSGATEALSLALSAVTTAGDAVAVECPSYYGTRLRIQSAGLQLCEVATDPNTGLQVDAFEALCRQRPIRALVVSGNVLNPTGACMPEAEKRRLLSVARQHGVCIIEDDVYGDFARYSGTGCSSLKAFDSDDELIYCSSFSKTLSPGLRIGWIASRRHHPALRELKAAGSHGTALVNQQALTRYLEAGRIETHLRRLVRQVDATRRRALDFVAQEFADGTQASLPRYGFLLWVRLPGVDSRDFARRAAEHGVVVMPGPPFGSCEEFAQCLRINVAQPWDTVLEPALRLLAGLTRQA